MTRLAHLQAAVSGRLRTPGIMAWVLVALLPGTAALCWLYGPAYLPRMAFAMVLGLAVEAAALRLQRRPIRSALLDGSALLTCLLLVLAMPPQTPYGVLALAVVTAVGLAKHLYGGLGDNPFNPAIVGYVVALVSFPAAMASWPAIAADSMDGFTGATVLTTFRYREGLTVADIWQANAEFGVLGGYGWEWVNAAFLAGGLMLIALGVASWRVPLALLVTLGGLSALGYDNGSSSSLGSPAFHWFSGGTMLAAFFFATDPVTHPSSARGQLAFGCLVGAMAFMIRSFGNYPDGIAFGILLGNAAAPFMDRYWTARRD
jgi:electron transport complex protein RnfD